MIRLIIILSLALSSCGSDEPGHGDQLSQEAGPCSKTETPVGDVSGLVFLINSLSKPLSLECLLSSLPGVIGLNATTSKLSVQPALSVHQPRVFLAMEDSLILSIVPGTNSLELSEILDGEKSVKGELIFPIEDEIVESLPYLNVSDSLAGRKRCGSFCHKNAVELETIGGVRKYASDMIAPFPGENVTLEQLKQSESSCEDEEYCSTLRAIFSHEDVESYSFPDSVPTL